MSQLKTKLTAIKADYDDSCEICDQLMGISNELETPILSDGGGED